MHLLVAGVRHHSAPIDVRERLALSDDEIRKAIPLLLASAGIAECAILTTCNRTEIYAAVDSTANALKSIKSVFKSLKGFDWDEYRQCVFTLVYEDAAIHLLRVAGGLDSLILGETQILGQVKEALSLAQEAKSTGTLIDKLFKTALSTGKRIRTETGIATRDLSVSKAAYEFAKQEAPDLLDRRIAIIGGGKMGEIVLSTLQREMSSAQAANVTIVNRGESRLKSLSEKFGFQGVTWDRLDEIIARSDVLFIATGAPHVVMGADHFAGKGPKLIMDISVPRNVDSHVGNLPDVRLFNTDNLSGLAGTMPDAPDAENQLMIQAEAIIHAEYAQFHQWQISLPIRPTIARLRAKMESIRQTEVVAAMQTTGNADMVDELTRNLVNKLLHEPMVRLKAAHDPAEVVRMASTINRLFNLDELEQPTRLGPVMLVDQADLRPQEA